MSDKEDRLRELIAGEAAEHYVARHDESSGPSAEDGLLAWLRRSPAHVAEYLGMVRLAKDVSSAAKHLDIPLERLIEEAREGANVVGLGARDARGWVPHRPSLHWGKSRRLAVAGVFAAIVAGLAAAVAVGIEWHPRPVDYATVRGEERTWRLPDNTIVRLDSDSRIRVTLDGSLRLVELERGRAYFEVGKDTSRQFRVLAGNTVLQDVGTSFDVFPKTSETVVTVMDGRVDLWDAEQFAGEASSEASTLSLPQPLANLRAGQQAILLPTGTLKTVAAVNLRRATAWLRHEIAFDEDRIGDVAAEFNRYNDIQIGVRDPRVANIAITGTFHTYDLDTFVQFLNSLPDVEATREGSPPSIIVKGRAKPERQ